MSDEQTGVIISSRGGLQSVSAGSGPGDETDYEYGQYNEEEDDNRIISDLPVPSSRPFGRQMPGFAAAASSTTTEDENDNGASQTSISSSNLNGDSSPDRRAAWHTKLSGRQRASIRASLRQSMRGSQFFSRRTLGGLQDSSDDDDACGAGSVGGRSGLLPESEPTPSRPSLPKNGSSSGPGAGIGPGNLVRQQSWFVDLVNQGMSSQELAAFLGENIDPDTAAFLNRSGAAYEQDQKQSALSGGGGRNDGARGGGGADVALLEQEAILTRGEARRRLVERLGYDPWERQKSEIKSNFSQQQELTAKHHTLHPPLTFYKNSSVCSSPSERQTNVKNRLRFLVPLPSTPKELFSWTAPKEWMEQRSYPAILASPNSEQRTQESNSSSKYIYCDLHTGEPVQHSRKAPPGYIVVRCLGCQQLQSVPSLATLIRCGYCRTVSPASSTRK